MTHYLLNNYLKYDKSNSTFTYLITEVIEREESNHLVIR